MLGFEVDPETREGIWLKYVFAGAHREVRDDGKVYIDRDLSVLIGDLE